jgi:glutaminyl-tRNA synthetase
MYRILHAEHHRSRQQGCIYPMYDSRTACRSIEGITHSSERWNSKSTARLPTGTSNSWASTTPQIEFRPLNIDYTV